MITSMIEFRRKSFYLRVFKWMIGGMKMAELKVILNDIESMQEFTNTVSKLDYNVYLRPEGDSEETKLNAKSLLTVMSLVVYRRLILIAQTDDVIELMAKLRPYLAKA